MQASLDYAQLCHASPVTNPLLNRSAILLKRSVLSDSCSSRKTNVPNGEIHNAVDVPNIGARRTASNAFGLFLLFSVEPAVACDCLMSQKRATFFLAKRGDFVLTLISFNWAWDDSDILFDGEGLGAD